MSQTIVRRNPLMGINYHTMLEDDGSIRVVSEQDCSQIVSAAQSLLRFMAPPKSHQKFKGDGFHLVGKIPMSILMEIERGPGDADEKKEAVLRWLEDHHKMKTTHARLI